jgi:hypothetical protein
VESGTIADLRAVLVQKTSFLYYYLFSDTTL